MKCVLLFSFNRSSRVYPIQTLMKVCFINIPRTLYKTHVIDTAGNFCYILKCKHSIIAVDRRYELKLSCHAHSEQAVVAHASHTHTHTHTHYQLGCLSWAVVRG